MKERPSLDEVSVHTYLYHRHDSGCEGGDGGGVVVGNLGRVQLFALGLVLEGDHISQHQSNIHVKLEMRLKHGHVIGERMKDGCVSHLLKTSLHQIFGEHVSVER